MHLIGVKEDDGWAFSRWELTYPVGWANITRAAAYAYEYYDRPEVLSGGERVEVEGPDEISGIPEDRTLTLRGFSTVLNVPISITFYNQIRAVDVNVLQMNEEFQNTDYEKFNHSLCQYLDSMELAMYRA
ncbi:MAG: hypothetical protein K6G56_05085 [Clostridiales bacterium]|nr:hypothetical protein [Clostridiales bacterium]